MPSRDPFEERTVEQEMALFSETAHVTDRVAAIACAAFVDGALMVALAGRFVHMGKEWRDRVFSGPTAPLGTFAGKIRIGYALALYGPKTVRDLDIVRQIRNDFAHTAPPITFEDEDIAKKCEQLTERHIILSGTPLEVSWGSAKARYVAAAQHIAISLIQQTHRPQRPIRDADALP